MTKITKFQINELMISLLSFSEASEVLINSCKDIVRSLSGNEITDVSEAGDLTWTTTNGNYSEVSNEYFPDHIGVWHLNLTSTSGAEGSLMLTVGHGQMASLELDASSTSITADEQVWINTTRIDIRGNRLPVLLDIDQWTTPQDSQLMVGAPAIWTPTSRGAKIIEATFETISTQITITVEAGAIVSLLLIVDNNVSTWDSFDITTDDILDVKVKAYDQKDNRWIISANWSIDHLEWSSQSSLEQLFGDETTFVPYYASATPYTITARYNDGFLQHEVSINVTVAHGDLNSVIITAAGSDGVPNTAFDLTADEYIDFSSELSDLDLNQIDSSILAWDIDPSISSRKRNLSISTDEFIDLKAPLASFLNLFLNLLFFLLDILLLLIFMYVMKVVVNKFISLVYATIILICNPLNINSILAADFIFEEKSGFSSEFKNENDDLFSLDNFKEKVLLVNLWATWCEPCKEEMPSLDNLQMLFDKNEFVVLPINLDRGPKKKALSFFDDFNIVNIETFFDDKNNIPREVKILGLPVTLLINKKGLEVARLIGPTEWTDEKILEIIRKEISN